MSDKWPKDVQVATLARKLLENHPVWIGSSRYSKEERSKAKEAVGGAQKGRGNLGKTSRNTIRYLGEGEIGIQVSLQERDRSNLGEATNHNVRN